MRLKECIFLVWSSLFLAKRTSMFRTEKGRLLFKWQGQEGIYLVTRSSRLLVPASRMSSHSQSCAFNSFFSQHDISFTAKPTRSASEKQCSINKQRRASRCLMRINTKLSIQTEITSHIHAHAGVLCTHERADEASLVVDNPDVSPHAAPPAAAAAFACHVTSLLHICSGCRRDAITVTVSLVKSHVCLK